MLLVDELTLAPDRQFTSSEVAPVKGVHSLGMGVVEASLERANRLPVGLGRVRLGSSCHGITKAK